MFLRGLSSDTLSGFHSHNLINSHHNPWEAAGLIVLTDEKMEMKLRGRDPKWRNSQAAFEGLEKKQAQVWKPFH